MQLIKYICLFISSCIMFICFRNEFIFGVIHGIFNMVLFSFLIIRSAAKGGKQ